MMILINCIMLSVYAIAFRSLPCNRVFILTISWLSLIGAISQGTSITRWLRNFSILFVLKWLLSLALLASTYTFLCSHLFVIANRLAWNWILIVSMVVILAWTVDHQNLVRRNVVDLPLRLYVWLEVAVWVRRCVLISQYWIWFSLNWLIIFFTLGKAHGASLVRIQLVDEVSGCLRCRLVFIGGLWWNASKSGCLLLLAALNLFMFIKAILVFSFILKLLVICKRIQIVLQFRIRIDIVVILFLVVCWIFLSWHRVLANYNVFAILERMLAALLLLLEDVRWCSLLLTWTSDAVQLRIALGRQAVVDTSLAHLAMYCNVIRARTLNLLLLVLLSLCQDVGKLSYTLACFVKLVCCLIKSLQSFL